MSDAIWNRLGRAYYHRELVLFAGAGLSVGAKLPSWKALLESCIDEAKKQDADVAEPLDFLKEKKFIEAFTALKREWGATEFNRFIRNELDDAKSKAIPSTHEFIRQMEGRLRGVVTTNLDRLMERTFEGRWPDFSKPPGNIAQMERFIFKPHGQLHDSKSWVFCRKDYDKVMFGEKDAASALQTLFRASKFLFIGFSFSDDNIEHLLGSLRANSNNEPPQHFAFFRKGEINKTQRNLLGDAGVSVLHFVEFDELPKLIARIRTESKEIEAKAKALATTAPAKNQEINAPTAR
jgi:hypothetical protein